MATRVVTRSSTSLLQYQCFSNSLKKLFSSLQLQQHSQYRRHISLANLLQRYGFPASKLPTFLGKNQPLLQNLNLSEIDKSLGILLLSFKLPQDLLVSMIFSCPGVLDLDFLRKWEVGIPGLGTLSSSPLMVRNVLEFSRRFGKDPDEFSRCVQVLHGSGFRGGTISRVLEEFPRVVMINEHELRKRVDFLKLVGLERSDINEIYSTFPGILGFGVEDRLKPLLDEFSQLGVSRRLLRQEIVREPRVLSLVLGELSRCVELLNKIKCREPIRQRIFSEGKLKAGFAVKLRVDCLCSYGMIHRDALNVLKREPRAIIYDIEDMVKKIEFLLGRMKMNIGCLIEVPEYLGVNFDKQILPRYNVIEYLRSIGGLGFEVGLRDLIKPSRLKFYNFYVKPYAECEKIFGRFSGDAEAKSRHPAGLWKLFKPAKYPQSKEDADNIRSFMEAFV
ncbi:hypothetical protein Ancab_038771 [Ancistrocladus abbreviatus]